MKIEEIQSSGALTYDPARPGKKVLIRALGSRLIGIEDDRHILTVTGSRSGKSVGLVSNLLFYPGSVLATDQKGELAELTARTARRGAPLNVDAVAVLKEQLGNHPEFCFTYRGAPIRWDVTNTA